MSCCARDAGKTISHGHKVITSEPLSPLEERPVVREAELEVDSLDLVGAVQHGAYHRVVKLLESGHGHQGLKSHTRPVYNRYLRILLNGVPFMLILIQGRYDTNTMHPLFSNF